MFGYGIENLQSAFVGVHSDDMIRQFGKVLPVDKAHNEYLHIMATSGVPSLFTYAIFLYFVLKKGFALSHQDSRYNMFMISIVAYLVQAFFNISVVSVAYIFWIFLGVISNPAVFLPTQEN